jgi:DNA topoisomerase-1
VTVAGPDLETLQAANLRHADDSKPGIRRIRKGRGFSYQAADGSTIRNQQQLTRIANLVIPPAWTDVWISPDPAGHLQATGIDDRGRKQYLYHSRWRDVRDGNKFDHMLEFARALPAIRKRVEEDLKRQGLPREKVLAVVVRLLEKTLIRIGNAEYAETNNSYGLATIRRKHVEVSGAEVRFQFTGKSGKEWDVSYSDRRIANVVRKCSDLPGYELFKYRDDDGQVVDVTSADVNDYLKEITGKDFTAKDFRTWAGTVLTAVSLDEKPPFASKREGEREVSETIKGVARELGNTPATCRKCYVHPAVVDAFLEGEMGGVIRGKSSGSRRSANTGLTVEERNVLDLLHERLETPA